jgi:hypothetical protein
MRQYLLNTFKAGSGTDALALGYYLTNGDLWCKQQSRREAGLKYKFTTE